MLIYKIFRAGEWAAFAQAGQTRGAPIDLADGFVHLSTGAQVARTAELYFAGVEGLKILALDADTLGTALRWEPSRGGDLFPHLFRALHSADVLWQMDLPIVDGHHVFPKGVLPE